VGTSSASNPAAAAAASVNKGGPAPSGLRQPGTTIARNAARVKNAGIRAKPTSSKEVVVPSRPVKPVSSKEAKTSRGGKAEQSRIVTGGKALQAQAATTTKTRTGPPTAGGGEQAETADLQGQENDANPTTAEQTAVQSSSISPEKTVSRPKAEKQLKTKKSVIDSWGPPFQLDSSPRKNLKGESHPAAIPARSNVSNEESALIARKINVNDNVEEALAATVTNESPDSPNTEELLRDPVDFDDAAAAAAEVPAGEGNALKNHGGGLEDHHRKNNSISDETSNLLNYVGQNQMASAPSTSSYSTGSNRGRATNPSLPPLSGDHPALVDNIGVDVKKS